MPTTPEHQLGSRIRELREARRITQDELARVVGVKPLAVGKWERSQANPSIENRLALANYFGVPPEEMGYQAPVAMPSEAPAWFEAFRDELWERLNRIEQTARKATR